jgi:hypothetical protein
MKAIYRGYEIDVRRERSLGAGILLYYTVIRESDGFICDDGCEDSATPVREMIKYLKEDIDDSFLVDDYWNENEE